MNTNLNDRIAGLLYGSLVADSLALGAHWIYEQGELLQCFGRVTDYLDPRKNSYHPARKRGQQTHYGDQALTLMESLENRGGFVLEGFAQDWQRMWRGYPGYFDNATRETMKNLTGGMAPAAAASPSHELGGASRIAPLLAWMANGPVDLAVAAARAQTALTHRSKIAGDAAEYLTRIVFALLAGEELPAALTRGANAKYDELDAAVMWKHIQEAKALDIAAAADSLGLACPIPQALPTTLMIVERCGDNLETALIENVMAGGDNASRGLALGMILGAAHGKSRIPVRWIEGLEASPRIEAFSQKLPCYHGSPMAPIR